MRCGVPASHVRNVIIWGNHSSTQYPDVHHCVVNMSGSELACFDAVKDDAWLKGDFITVSARKFTTICRTMRDSFSFIVCFPVSHLKIKHRNIENCFFSPKLATIYLALLPQPLSVSLYFCVRVHALLPQTVQQRGAAVIKARKLSSAMSAAKAICDHMRDIWSGTTEVSTIFTYSGFVINGHILLWVHLWKKL